MKSSLTPNGGLAVRRLPAPLERPVIRSVGDALRHGTASGLGLPWARRRFQQANRENFERSLEDQHSFARGRLAYIGHLWLTKVDLSGKRLDLGLVSCRVVTDTGVGFLVDAMQGLVEPEAMRFHGLGTGAAAEAVGNTALGTEITTAYSTANTRPTGTLGEKTADSKTYETSATITVGSAVAATEHGIFSQAAVPGGVLLDRSVFAVVNLGAGEALQATYQLTLPSGG